MSPMQAVQPSVGVTSSDAGLPLRCRESGLGSDLSSRGPTQPRELWHLALEKLQSRDADGASEAQRLARYASTATGSNGQPLSGQALCESVAKAAQDKLDIASARSRWVIKAGGRSVSLRVILDNMLSFIDKFKEAGDVAVSFDPVHAALPWAGIRFVLQAVTAHQKATQQLVVGMDTATFLILRCNVYEQLYLSAVPSLEAEQAILNLRQAILELYTELLSFISVAARRYERHSAATVLKDMLSGDDLSRRLQSLSQLETRVNIEATVCGRAIDDYTQRRLGKSYEVLRDMLNTRLAEIDDRLAAVWENVEESERRDILQWISEVAYESDHYNARSDRTPGTGEWLLHHCTFVEWAEIYTSTILWLHGIPGAGKTKLSSKVVDSVLERLEMDDDDEALAYFYCDRNRQDHSDPLGVLRSLVRQIAVSRDGSGIIECVRQVYLRKKGLGFASKTLTTEESTELLQKLTECFSRITIIVDGLDECNAETRGTLIRALDLVVETAGPLSCFKVFIASRNDEDLKSRYSEGKNHEISAADNQGDIEKFVLSKLDQNEWCRKKMSADLRAEVQTVFREKSQAMFQWAALHIGDLVKFKREKDVRQYLQSLPKGLKKAYDEIYNNIQSREGSAGEIATRAFQWLMCSWRPLHPEELVLAVYQDPAGDFEFEADFDIDYVLEACHNLIVVAHEARRKGEEEDGTNYNLVCRFSHLSVQEYFEQNHWSRDDCHTIAACTCLRYLTNDTLLHSIERANSVRDAFSTIHGYVDGWFNHVRDFDNTDFSEEIKRMLDIFLGDDPYGTTTYYIDWIRHADLVQISPTNFWKGGIAHRIITAGVTPPILARDICQPVYSALCGCICMELTPIIGHWLVEDRLQPDAEVSGEKLLAVASSFEDIRLCKAFIDSGADVNAPSLRLGSALQAALEGHFHDPMNVGIVELLLENGADVNMAAGRCGTALQRAAWRSPPRRHILQLLLDRGANVNASQGEMGTVLQLTAYNKTFMKDPQACHEALSYLIGHGADVNVVAGTLGSALQGVAALGDSHIAAAMLLLDHGADVNQISGEFGTALQAAAWKGSQGLSTTMLLLGRGADANLVGGKFGTALQAAVISADKLDFEELTREQWQEIPLSSLQQPMSLLLKAGADVMIRGGKYGTALQAAAIKRTRELRVLEFFLQYLSGTQIADDELGAALRRAAANGDDAKPALAVLLEHGADVNATDPNEGTALHAAARTSRGIETAKYLLDCGADIHACCTLHGTPLHAAVASGEGGEDLVGYLIDRGANVHAIGGPFETVLQAAAASLQVSRGTINLLMKWEVDLNAKGGKYGTAIRAAFHNNHCPWEYKYEIMSKFMSSGAEFAANDFGLDPMTSEDTMLKDLRRILRVGGLDTPQISEIYDTRTRHPSAEPVLPRAPIRTRFYHIL